MITLRLVNGPECELIVLRLVSEIPDEFFDNPLFGLTIGGELITIDGEPLTL